MIVSVFNLTPREENIFFIYLEYFYPAIFPLLGEHWKLSEINQINTEINQIISLYFIPLSLIMLF